MKPNRINALPLFLLLLISLPLQALESDKNQPVYIEADSVEINDGTGISVYQGNVDVTQGSIHLTADKVTVTQRPGNANHIRAEGNPVTFKQNMEDQKKPIEGSARIAEYDTESEILHMIGNAVLLQGKDSFKSDRISYDRSKSLVRAGTSAKGKERVKISIQSKKSQKAFE
ncbi:MAG: lipopolysaccharide transport periplasmic protein LptA [Gammaproteobacteria bacterium]|nr:lipopolysaccharide transport periplasmic protein LptA [Gammaproteobacteria bacterium]